MESPRRSYKVVLERKVEKQLRALSRTDYIRVSKAIEKIAQNPRSYNAIKLTDSDDEYRFRVGDFRILYTIEDHILHVYIFEILNRKDAYR